METTQPRRNKIQWDYAGDRLGEVEVLDAYPIRNQLRLILVDAAGKRHYREVDN